MSAHLQAASSGVRGFDTNVALGRETAKLFREAGFQFAVRYVPRINRAPHDLTPAEVEFILDAGLGLMVVQHVEPGVWSATAEKGWHYGATAAREATACGLPPGTMLWLDMESVGVGGDPVAYANRWHSQVAGAGFVPGIYVGWQCGISPADLYYRLRFTHYWGAYNLNRDEWPVVRGLQMKQVAPTTRIGSISYDTNITCTDQLGGRVQILTPLGP
jgi:hypothetical protein